MMNDDPFADLPELGAPARGPVYGPAPKADKPPSGYTGGTGGMNYIPGGPADPYRPGGELDPNKPDKDRTNTNFDNTAKLRGEYNGLQPVKTYAEFMPVLSGAIRAPKNAQGDLAVLISFSKAMDPTTGVKEGETQMAMATASQVAQAEAWIKKVNEGQRLPPEVRNQFIETMRQKGIAFRKGYQQSRDRYRQLAESNNFDPAQIIGDHVGDSYKSDEDSFTGFDKQKPMSLQDFQAQMEALVADKSKPAEQRLQEALALAKSQNRLVDPAEVEAAAKAGGGRVVENPDFVPPQLAAQKIAEYQGQAGVGDLIGQGATLGLGDEAAGVGNMLANAVTSPFTDTNFDPGGAYTAGRDAERMRLDEARQRLGWGGTAAEIGAGLLSGNVSGAVKAAPTLLGRMGQGAGAGAGGGTVGGFGYGEGVNSVPSAAIGAVGGATIGSLLPVAGTVIGNRVDGLRRLTGKDPELPRRIVSEAIEADGASPATVGAMMDQARGRGSPMMLADTGDNARELLASVGRQPGPSRTITREAIGNRQSAQTERISDAVVRDLGPTANIRDMGDALVEQARTASRPIYKKFEDSPGASSVKLDDLAMRPSFRKALLNAANTAAEEGSDGAALGFQFDAAGDVVLTSVPSFRTLDAIKKGLDDVIEGYRDGTSGKLNLTTGEARATEATRKALVHRMDKINPHYKAARDAYAGPVRMKDALEKGAKALNKRPDDIMAMMKGMGESERESFRLGVRKAVVELLESKRDGGDKVAALIGTPKSRHVLTQVFGGKANFNRFIDTLRDEELMGRTFRSVHGNSATAGRVAQDAQTVDDGLVEGALDSALRGQTMWGSAVAAFQKLRDVERFGAGQAGQRTRESVAALLSETDPAVLRDLISAAKRAAVQQAARSAGRSRNAVRGGRATGNVSGMTAGRSTEN